MILSHRAVVEKEQSERKQEFLQTLEAGQVLEGKVQRLTDFGAFVDIGGIDGLVHISQLSHSHVENRRTSSKKARMSKSKCCPSTATMNEFRYRSKKRFLDLGPTSVKR